MSEKPVINAFDLMKQKSRELSIKEKEKAKAKQAPKKSVTKVQKTKKDDQVSKRRVEITKIEDITDDLLQSYKNEDDQFIIPALEDQASMIYNDLSGQNSSVGEFMFERAEKRMLFEYLMANSEQKEMPELIENTGFDE